MKLQNVKFALGEIVLTPAAAAALEVNGLLLDDLLARHQGGDWGNVSSQVRDVNDQGLTGRYQLHSAFELPDGGRLAVVTNRQRTATMVHLDVR